MNRYKLSELVQTEDEQLQKLNGIVLEAINEEKLLTQKIMEFEDRNPSLSSKMADKVASFGGSWKFIVFFIGFMIVWMSLNLFWLTKSFDPYPFILLNLMLSAIAAIQAPIIMMSQNRKEEKDRQRAVNDYLINLKAEIEIRNMHSKLDLLIGEQMKTLFEIQKGQVEMMDDIISTIKTYSKNDLVISKDE
jgi:uncharacterized membrane protein